MGIWHSAYRITLPATDGWNNAHDGAYHLAKSCAGVRNILAHRADVPISSG